MKILLAWATWYLWSHIAKELMAQNIEFKAIVRDINKLEKLWIPKEYGIIWEITKPETLKWKLNWFDTVISCVWITRQKDGLTYMDVDYGANMNLLSEAKNSWITKMLYISAINGDKMKDIAIFKAKEWFVSELKKSWLKYTIMRPNWFFSDMKDFLDMAKWWRVYLFWNWNNKVNPIEWSDLAKSCIEKLFLESWEFSVWWPDILTHNDIAKLALKSLWKPEKISYIPDSFRWFVIKVLRIFTSVKFYGPFEFFLTIMWMDNIWEKTWKNRLEDFFNNEAPNYK